MGYLTATKFELTSDSAVTDTIPCSCGSLITNHLDTGAGSGIGRHAALLFAQEGASVVVADRNLASACRTVEAMHELNGQGVAVGGDVSVADDVAAMVAKAEKVIHSHCNVLAEDKIFHCFLISLAF